MPMPPNTPKPGVLNSMYKPAMPIKSSSGLIAAIQVPSSSAPSGLTSTRFAPA